MKYTKRVMARTSIRALGVFREQSWLGLESSGFTKFVVACEISVELDA
jgi:hypothetical protein